MTVVPMAALSRAKELATITDVVASAAVRASGLVIAGEAGIGKTMVWLAGIERAAAEGFRVLSARVGQAESVLGYATVADVLTDVEPEVLDELPDVQRIALHRILLRAEDGPETGQWVAAAAFPSVVEALTRTSPVLLAIDDVQWLDSSSRAVVEFATRRLGGRVGVLATVRTDSDSSGAAGWLQVSRPDGVGRLQVTPMSLGALHEMISTRFPMPFERARTLLLLGQLQRRKRQKQNAVDSLRSALRVFAQLGAPLWAQRTRAELSRTNVGCGHDADLTPLEQRVAELAASVMTTRAIAAALFISPKTVEHNIGRIYRKLGIRTRDELGRRIQSQ
jgi:DNA-binding CsgD family transcriptional regulator